MILFPIFEKLLDFRCLERLVIGRKVGEHARARIGVAIVE